MAWYNSLKDLTGDIGKGATAVGHTVGSVASNPWVEAGLGALTGGATIPLLAGGLGGLLKPGGNLGGAATGALKGGLAGYGGSKIPGILGGFNTGGVTGGVQAIGNALGGLGGVAKGLGGLGGALGLGGGGGVQGLGDLAKYGLGAAQMVNQAALQKKSSDYATNAYNQANDAYTAKAPLRAQGQAGLLNGGQGNPFASRPAVQPLSLGGG